MKQAQIKSKIIRLKMNNIVMVTLLSFTILFSKVSAQKMHVKESNGTQTTYSLSDIQKMSFSSGNLTVTKTDNISVGYALGDLRYLKFADISTSLSNPLPVQSQRLSVYPNPVKNFLNIDLTGEAQGEGIISIFNFEGKTVLSQQVRHAGVYTVDMTRLPKGIYLCNYSNASEIKTVKIIKQ